MGRSCDERGALTVGFVLAAGLSLVLLSTFANLLVQQYALAAAEAALDEGVRAGSVVDGTSQTCTTRARTALRAMLGGRYGRALVVGCLRGPSTVSAFARGRLPGFAPLVPDLRVDLRATATAERV